MPAFVYWIGAFLLAVAPSLVRFFTAHFAKAIGFSVVAFTGLHFGLKQLTNHLQTNIGGLPADISAILGLLGLDTGLNIILSTFVWVAAYKGLSRDRAYKPVWRKPGSGPKLPGDFEA